MKVDPSRELFFGQDQYRSSAKQKLEKFSKCKSQHLSMELYEGRIASLERFVAITVMFHELGSNVQKFFPAVPFGYLGYSIDQTQSMLRVATTASLVSGADVRDRMETMKHTETIKGSIHKISSVWSRYRSRKTSYLLKQNS